MKFNNKIKTLCAFSFVSLLGCQSANTLNTQEQINAPANWHQQTADSGVSAQDIFSLKQFLAQLNTPELSEYLQNIVTRNRGLAAKKQNLAAAYQQVIIADATDFPELSLSANQARRKTINNGNENYVNNAELSLSLTYELDIWGKLSAQQQQAYLNYQAAKANYLAYYQQLLIDVSKAWFNLIEAQQLLNLYTERAGNLENNLKQIQASYQLGLNQALDVYLAQNDVSREKARIAEQQQNVLRASRALELYAADYPAGKLSVGASLPSLTPNIYAGLPSDLISRRPDLNASWYQLLALDAGLAVSHKQRFPRLALTGSAGKNSEQFENLFDGGALAWSLIGNITMPLFNAGRLAAQEERARLAVKEQEQLYLQDVYNAFRDVENLLSNQQALTERYQQYLSAQENATTAEKLAFDQYLKGLVKYTVVLEAQRRAYDTQTTLVQLQNQLLQNQLNLSLALGGEVPAEEAQNNTVSE